MTASQPAANIRPNCTAGVETVDHVIIDKIFGSGNNLLSAGQVRENWSDENIGRQSRVVNLLQGRQAFGDRRCQRFDFPPEFFVYRHYRKADFAGRKLFQ